MTAPSRHSQEVLLEWRGPVAVLRIARPLVRNALDAATLDVLERSLDEVAARDGAVLVVRGSGGSFCSGLDLNYLAGLGGQAALVRAFIVRFCAFLDALRAAPFVSVAVVEGAAVAGGLELMLSCDLAIATDDSVLGDRHVRRGLVPGAGGASMLVAALGPSRARWLLYTGATVDGRQAAEWGLVNLSVPAADLERRVEQLADEVAGHGAARRLLKQSLSRPDPAFTARLRAERESAHEHILATLVPGPREVATS